MSISKPWSWLVLYPFDNSGSGEVRNQRAGQPFGEKSLSPARLVACQGSTIQPVARKLANDSLSPKTTAPE
jgi:hypothetical protein